MWERRWTLPYCKVIGGLWGGAEMLIHASEKLGCVNSGSSIFHQDTLSFGPIFKAFELHSFSKTEN